MMLELLFWKGPKISIGLSNRGLFVEKLAPLRKLYPVPVSFLFIVGFDTILRVMDKRYYRDRPRAIGRLFQECQFWVAHRREKREDSFEDFFGRKENRGYRNQVFFFVLPDEVSFLSSKVLCERPSDRENRQQGWSRRRSSDSFRTLDFIRGRVDGIKGIKDWRIIPS